MDFDIREAMKTEPISEEYSRFIQNMRAVDHAAVETLVEKALQGGKYGVKIIRTYTGLFVFGEVSPDVPYGHIHQHNIVPDKPFDSNEMRWL